MIYFVNNEHNPYYNLALEEVLAKSELNEDILMLWQNNDAVIIGRNQNAYEELNVAAVNRDNVAIVRRLSGGGAVFQDLGNICYTFIVNTGKSGRTYKEMCAPIIKTLNRLGVKAEFCGKNDIKVKGMKISGLAQYIYRNRLVHHGTLLFDVDLNRMGTYLKEDHVKLKSKGIKSNRAQVTNIVHLFTDKTMTIPKLFSEIADDMVESAIAVQEIPFEYQTAAQALVDKKYDTWQWKYGVFPSFSYKNKQRFDDRGSIEVLLNIDHGKISDIKFYGDFMGAAGTELIEQKLIGVKYLTADIAQQLDESLIKSVFGEGFGIADLLPLITNTKN